MSDKYRGKFCGLRGSLISDQTPLTSLSIAQHILRPSDQRRYVQHNLRISEVTGRRVGLDVTICAEPAQVCLLQE